jgi:hypothetical protein
MIFGAGWDRTGTPNPVALSASTGPCPVIEGGFKPLELVAEERVDYCRYRAICQDWRIQFD